MLQSDLPSEEPIDPDLPIIDPHHHIRDYSAFASRLTQPDEPWQGQLLRCLRHLEPEVRADLGSGHRIVATVHVECSHGYRTDGPDAMKPVGETAFVVKQARKLADTVTQVCAGIVGHVDLTLGNAVVAALEGHVEAGEGRFRGIRHSASWDADEAVLRAVNGVPGLYRSDAFRAGFVHLAPMGLVFDAWLLEPQLPDLIDLADAFPDTAIVLDHLGTPVGAGRYAGRQMERFAIWRDAILRLAQRPNVTLKLGGLGMDYTALPGFMADPPATSEQLAREWLPWMKAGIDAFGPDRCMFESNYPSECGAGRYGTIWNAFKRIAAGASTEEKAALFAGTAARVYGIAV